MKESPYTLKEENYYYNVGHNTSMVTTFLMRVNATFSYVKNLLKVDIINKYRVVVERYRNSRPNKRASLNRYYNSRHVLWKNYKGEYVPKEDVSRSFNMNDILMAYEYCYSLKCFYKKENLFTGNYIHLLASDVPSYLIIGSRKELAAMGPIVVTDNYPLFSSKAHWSMEYKNIFSTYSHPFHLVDPSPWPLCTSIGLWYLTLTTVAFFHNFLHNSFNIVFGIMYLCICLGFWWRDVIRESTYEFKHTPYVRRGLLNGMLLFIVSEIMFFFGFFWAFFHVSLAPSYAIGAVWPPAVIAVISPWQLPLVNTLCLLLSGVSLTIAHRQLTDLTYYSSFSINKWGVLRRLVVWLQVTVFLGVFFLCCQACEYYLSPFTFQDTVFGGTFYILTGLHGLHVVVGTIFLMVCLWRASRLHFTLWKQVGFKAAVWYWHFVDVVWIFLFIVIYVWGGLA